MDTPKITSIHPKVFLVTTITALAALSSSGVNALAITAAVDYTLGAGPVVVDVDGPATTPGSTVYVLSGDSSPDGSVFYHTYGNDTGLFGSRVSGDGVFDITGTYSYFNEFTNTSATSESFVFDFTVIPGEVSVFGDPNPGEEVFASYELDILLNGSSIWGSSTSILLEDSGYTFAQTGSSIGGTYNGGNSYAWNTFSESLGLGSFDSGETFTIEYNLTSHASSTVSDCDGSFGGGFDGELDVEFGDGEFGDREGGFGGGCANAIARIGDPFGVGGSNSASVGLTKVPAPGVLFLFASGLGFVLTKRKRIHQA